MIPQTLVQCSGGYKCVSFDLFRPQNVCNFELTFLNMGATPPWLQSIFWPLSASECLQLWVNIPQYGRNSPLVTTLYLLTSFRLRMLAICSEQEFYKRARRLSCRGEYCIFCIFWQILTRGLGPERSWNLSFIRVVQNRRFRSKYPPYFLTCFCVEYLLYFHFVCMSVRPSQLWHLNFSKWFE